MTSSKGGKKKKRKVKAYIPCEHEEEMKKREIITKELDKQADKLAKLFLSETAPEPEKDIVYELKFKDEKAKKAWLKRMAEEKKKGKSGGGRGGGGRKTKMKMELTEEEKKMLEEAGYDVEEEGEEEAGASSEGSSGKGGGKGGKGGAGSKSSKKKKKGSEDEDEVCMEIECLVKRINKRMRELLGEGELSEEAPEEEEEEEEEPMKIVKKWDVPEEDVDVDEDEDIIDL
jgi:hypothetical protein